MSRIIMIHGFGSMDHICSRLSLTPIFILYLSVLPVDYSVGLIWNEACCLQLADLGTAPWEAACAED